MGGYAGGGYAPIPADNPKYVPRDDWDQNGFANRTDSDFTFDDDSATLPIQPTASKFSFFVGGKEFESTGDTVTIDDTKEGIHVIYYNSDGVLTSLANPSPSDIQNCILHTALVSILYWDVSESKQIYLGEERHGKNMSSSSHNYHHFIDGLTYVSGLGLNTISIDGTGVTVDAQFGVDSGTVADEDLHVSISAIGSTVGLPIYYMLGLTPTWEKHIESGFSVRTYDGTSSTRLAFNQYSNGAWKLTEVSHADFALYHVFATTEKSNPMIVIMGQNIYTTKRAARKGAKTEIQGLILNELLFPEIRPIATFIVQTKLTYANSVNARFVSTDEGDDYIDWRSETISRTVITSNDHNALSNLQGGGSGDYFHLSQTEYDNVGMLQGVKTPANAGDTGTLGDICWDSNYIYICTATDTWKRVAISTW